MRSIYKKIKVLSLIVLSIVLFVNMTQISFVMAGSIQPEIQKISTLEELLDWYSSKEEEGPLSMLTADIVIDQTVELLPTAGYRCINGGGFAIRVEEGGSLTVENQNVEIMGKETFFIVENGGTLNLNAGFFDVAEGKALIHVKKGGTYAIGADALLGGAEADLIIDENDPVEPPTDPVGTPIVEIYEEFVYYSYLEGKAPAAPEYPSTARVITDTETFHVPVLWDTSTVRFDTVGVYECIGTFTEEALATESLSNPKGLTVPMIIEIYKEAPLDSVKVEVRHDEFGNYKAKIIFPRLPEDEIEAIHIDKSNDGKTWEECGDFKEEIQTIGMKSHILYHYSSDSRPAFLRSRIVGSAYAGTTNVLDLEILGEMNPDSDDEDTGNRGGGTQREEERDKEISEDIMAVERELTLEEEEAMDSLVMAQSETDYEKEELLLGPIRKNSPHGTPIRGRSGLVNERATIDKTDQDKTVEVASSNLNSTTENQLRKNQIMESENEGNVGENSIVKAMLVILGAIFVFAITQSMMKKRKH